MRLQRQRLRRRVFIRRGGGEVCSMVEMVVIPDLFGDKPAAYIHKVNTDRGFEGKGLASGLVLEAVRAARKMGCYKVFLICDSKNMAFYRRLGFSIEQLGMVLRL